MWCGYTRARECNGFAEPGGFCPFVPMVPCQEGCWAWRFDGETDRCFAFDDLPDGMSPRDWYCACLQEVDGGSE